MAFGLLTRVGFLLFLVATYKTLPFSYCIRFYYLVLKNVVLTRLKYRQTKQNTFGITGKSKHDLFRAIDYHSYASPLEIDMYLHKSNSTYFLDLDLARTQMVSKVFQKLFMSYYDNEFSEFKGKKFSNYPYVPVGLVQCLFKKEIKLFQRYTISSNVLAWDDKWLYVLLKFVVSNNKLAAVAVTKYVFKKNGRITIKPRDFISQCDLYNEEVEKINRENFKLVEHINSTLDGLDELAERMSRVLQ